MEKRDTSLDFIRIWAMMMVIIIHVSDVYLVKTEFSNPIVFMYEGISHCANPLFLMLTGVLVLEKSGGVEPESFWKKSFIKLGIPTLFFAMLTWISDLISGEIGFNMVIKDLIKGWYQHYPYWYMAMLAGIYFILPFASRAKKAVSFKTWKRFVIIYFVWGIGSLYFQEVKSAWIIAVSLSYFGYVLLGDFLKDIEIEKNNTVGLLMIVLGSTIMIADYYILFLVVQSGGDYYNMFLWGYKAPLMILGIILVFIGFNKLVIDVNMSKLSGYSFGVYLSQRLVINILEKYGVFDYAENKMRGCIGIAIFVMSMLVFLLSLIISMGYEVCKKTILNMIILTKRNNVKEKI